MEKANVTVRLEKDAIALLDEFAQADDRDRSYLIKTAIDNYLKIRQWQREEILKAIAEADEGDFATDAEVKQMFDELGK